MRTGKERSLFCVLIVALLFLTGISGCSSKKSDSSSQSTTPAAPAEPAAPGLVAAGAPADLLGTSLSFIPDGSQQPASEVTVGQKGTFNSTVFNAGGTDANSVLVRFEVDDANSGEATIPVVSQSQEAQSSSIAYTFNDLGLRTIHLAIDPNNQVVESDEGNNGDLTTTVNVVAAPGPGGGQAAVVEGPDLLGSRLYFKPAGSQQQILQTVAGQAGDLGATIFNAGTAEAANATGRIEIDGVSAGNVTFGVTPAGQASPPGLVSHTFSEPGTYSLRLFVDPFPGETNTNNNDDTTATIEVLAAVPPDPGNVPATIDLTGSSIYFVPDNTGDAALSTTVGQSALIKGAIFNSGNATAFDVLVRATDNGADAGQCTVSSVDAGGEANIPPIPYTFATPDLHTLQLVINPFNNPRETNPNNNNNLSIDINVLPAPGEPPQEEVLPKISIANLDFLDQTTGSSLTDTTTDKPGFIFMMLFNDSDTPASNVEYYFMMDGRDKPMETAPSIAAHSVFTKTYDPLTLNPDFYTVGVHSIGLFIKNGQPIEIPSGSGSRVISVGMTDPVPPTSDEQHPIKASGIAYTYSDGVPLNVAETGKDGYIYASVQNLTDHVIENANFNIYLAGQRIGPDGPRRIEAGGYATERIPKKFDQPGRYKMELSVTGERDPDYNYTVSYIEVTRDIYELIRRELARKPIRVYPKGTATPVTRIACGRKCNIITGISNVSIAPAKDIPVELKIDGVVKKSESLDLGPMETRLFILHDYAFTRAGNHKISLSIDTPERRATERNATNNEAFANILAMAVIPTHDAAVKTFELANPVSPTRPDHAPYRTVVDASGLKSSSGNKNITIYETLIGEDNTVVYNIQNTKSTPISNLRAVVYVDGAIKDDRRLNIAGNETTPPVTIRGIKFRTLGFHSISIALDPDNELPETDENTNNNDRIFIRAGSSGNLGQTQHTVTGEKKGTMPTDIRAVDIGFIPDGAKGYLDQIYKGERGSLVGIFSNDSMAEMQNVKIQIIDNGKVVRQAMKPSVKGLTTEEFRVDNYSFNTLGKHRLIFTVDPDNTIKEKDKKNNYVAHTVRVIPRTKRPTASSYDASGAVRDILGSFDQPKKPGPYTPPPDTPPTTYTPPKVTTTTVDQGGSSSGTSKKKVPVFTTKGLGT